MIAPAPIGEVEPGIVSILPDAVIYSEEVGAFSSLSTGSCVYELTYEAFLDQGATLIPSVQVTGDTRITFDPIARNFTFQTIEANQTIPIIVRATLSDAQSTSAEISFDLVVGESESTEEYMVSNKAP